MALKSLAVNIGANTTGFQRGIQAMQKGFQGASSSVASFTSLLAPIAGLVAAAFSIRAIVDFTKSCIDLGSAVTEVQNVVDVTFGQSAGLINAFAKTSATTFGVSELSAKKYTGTLGAMLKSMGLSTDASLGMSTAITGLSGDMASFYNLDTDTAFEKIRSGISGETEPLKQLGINMSVANLEAYALSKGIKQSYGKMDQASQALLRYEYLMSVTADAQGDFARTTDTWANQTRVLSLQFDSLKATLGQGLINLLTPLLKLLNQLVAKAQHFADVFLSLTALITGKKAEVSSGGSALAAAAMANSASSSEDVAKNMSKTSKSAKEIKKSLAGFDELNILSSGAASSAEATSADLATPVIGSALGGGALSEISAPDIDLSKFHSVIDTIKTALQPAKDALWGLGEQMKRLGGFAWQGLQGFYTGFLQPVGDWVIGEGLPRFITSLTEGLANVNWGNINKSLDGLWAALAPFAINVGEGLLWLWEKVLVPVGEWTLNELVPAFLDTLAESINFINAAINAAKPGFKVLWEKFLKPIGKWGGGAFLEILGSIKNAFADMTKVFEEKGDKVTAVMEAMSFVFGIVWQAIQPFFQQIVDIVKAVWGSLAGFFSAGIDMMYGVVEFVSGIFTGDWERAWGGITSYIDGIKKTWQTLFNLIVDIIIAAFKPLVDNFKRLWEAIQLAFSGVPDWFRHKFNEAVNQIKAVFAGVKDFFTGVWTGVQLVFGLADKWLEEKFGDAWRAVKAVFSGVGMFFGGIWDTIKTKFTTIGTSVGDAMGTAFKTVVNTVLNFAENTINGFIKAINTALNVINDIPGVDIGTLEMLSIPKLAYGGIVSSPTIAMVGERGKEAVMPLENNTGWINELASKIAVIMQGSGQAAGAGGNITVPVYIGTDLIEEIVINAAQRAQFRTNGRV